MLLRQEDSDTLVAIGQPSHAWVSGQLARAWGNERFGEISPREEVCLGAEQHDVGMALWDLEPDLNPETSLPYSFIEMPLESHMALWSAAPRKMLAQSRYAALLVSMHGAALYGLRDLDAMPGHEAEAVRGYLTEQSGFQEELLATLRADEGSARFATEECVSRNQRLMWTWDFLSLGVCLDWAPCTAKDVPTAGGPTDVELVPVAGEGDRCTLDPWPFSSAHISVRCEGRRLRGRFEDEAAMRSALRRAPWVTLRFELLRT